MLLADNQSALITPCIFSINTHNEQSWKNFSDSSLVIISFQSLTYACTLERAESWYTSIKSVSNTKIRLLRRKFFSTTKRKTLEIKFVKWFKGERKNDDGTNFFISILYVNLVGFQLEQLILQTNEQKRLAVNFLAYQKFLIKDTAEWINL